MAINYSEILSNEQKINILNQRIAQFAAEAWQHELNKRTCMNLNDEAGVESSTKALEVLEAAIAVHQAELNLIDK